LGIECLIARVLKRSSKTDKSAELRLDDESSLFNVFGISDRDRSQLLAFVSPEKFFLGTLRVLDPRQANHLPLGGFEDMT